MPRTQTSWLQDTALPDGKLCFGPGSMVVVSGATGISFNPPNFGLALALAEDNANVIAIAMNSVPFRSGVQDDLQQAFGGGGTDPSTGLVTPLIGAQGLASPPANFTTPAGVSGAPPFPGISQLQPVTVPRGKGIQVNSITLVYTVAGAPLTLHTVGVWGFSYPILNPGTDSGFGPSGAWLELLPPAQYNLQTAVTAGGGIVTSNIPLAIPAFITPPHPQVVIVWSVTTPATGTATLYEAVAYCGVNFN